MRAYIRTIVQDPKIIAQRRPNVWKSVLNGTENIACMLKAARRLLGKYW